MSFSEAPSTDDMAKYRARALDRLAQQERAEAERIEADRLRKLETAGYEMRRREAEAMDRSRQQLATLKPLYEQRDAALKKLAGPLDEFWAIEKKLKAAEDEIRAATPLPRGGLDDTWLRLRRGAGLPAEHYQLEASEVSKFSERTARAITLGALNEAGITLEAWGGGAMNMF